MSRVWSVAIAEGRRVTSNAQLLPFVTVNALAIAAFIAVLGLQIVAIAIAVPAIAAGIWYVIHRPLVLVVGIIVAEVANVGNVVGGPAKVVLRASLALGLVAIILALRDPVMRSRVTRGTWWCVALIACYLLTQMLAVLGSRHVDASAAQFWQMIVDCTFLVIVLVLIQLSGKPWVAAMAVVVPLAVLSLLCIVNEIGYGGTQTFGGFAKVSQSASGLIVTPRYAGPTADANFWGRQLMIGLPLVSALVVRALRSDRREFLLGWSAALVVMLGGVYLTQSRGAFITNAVVFLVWVLAGGRKAIMPAVMSLPPLAVLLFVPGIGDRLVQLGGFITPSDLYHEAVESSLVGRRSAQEVAWQIFMDRPVFGFGQGTFRLEIANYAGLVPTAYLDWKSAPNAAHNLYLQIAAESGLVGLIGFIVFAGGFLWIIANRMVHMPATDSQRPLVAAVFAAIIGWLVASVFLHMAYFRTFAIVLALAGALAFAERPGIRPTMPWGRILPKALISCVVGVAVASGFLVANGTRTYTSSQKVILVPSDQMAGNLAYAIGLRGRSAFQTTYAAMMRAGGPDDVKSKGDFVRGVITISVTKDQPDRARSGLVEALDHGRAQLAYFKADGAFYVAPVGSRQDSSKVKWSPGSMVIAVALGIAATVGTGMAFRRRYLRQVRDGERTAPG